MIPMEFIRDLSAAEAATARAVAAVNAAAHHRMMAPSAEADARYHAARHVFEDCEDRERMARERVASAGRRENPVAPEPETATLW